jgi:hypothetical protein
MNPKICASVLAFEVLVLKWAIQIRINRAAHEESPEPAWELRAKPTTTTCVIAK